MISAENAEFEGATCRGRRRCGGGEWTFECGIAFWICFVDVDNERGRGGGERRAPRWQSTLEVWACSKRRGVRTSQVSAVRRVGRTSAVAVSLAGPDIDIAASVIVMRTQIGCRMCALHR